MIMTTVTVPLFIWLAGDGLWSAIVVQFVLAVLLAVPLGSAPAMFVELFPATDRLSGYSVAYNIGLGVIGGATPMLATWLMRFTGCSFAPAGLQTAAALVACVAVIWIRDRSREPLP